MRANGLDIINLGIGSPDLAPSPQTIQATVTALHDEKNHGYASYRSSPELRKALADWYQGLYGVTLDDRGEILPLLGSKEGIHYISMAFLNPGDTVLVPNPGYPTYASTATLSGANVRYYDLTDTNDWFPNFEEIERSDLSNCKMMWVNYPHMPTGKKANQELFRRLVAFGKKHGILICHDNPYGLVLNQETPISIFSEDPEKEICLELNSFSKAFNMAGWRIGMVAGSKEVIDCIAQVKSNVDSGMFLPIQIGAIAALKNSDEWHAQRNATYAARRNVVWQMFDHLGFEYSREACGLFVWGKAPDHIRNIPEYLDRLLLEAHVFFVPGEVFGSNGARYVRSSLCASVQVLDEALARIVHWKGTPS